MFSIFNIKIESAWFYNLRALLYNGGEGVTEESSSGYDGHEQRISALSSVFNYIYIPSSSYNVNML